MKIKSYFKMTIKDCHPERSEGSRINPRGLSLSLRMAVLLPIFVFLLFGFYSVVGAVDLQVPIPGQPNAGKDLSSYISAWYTFGVSAIGIIAVVMIMWAGMQWITAMGNASQIGQAKERISNAIIGLVLALCSYGILYLINPSFVELKMPNIKKIGKEDINIKGPLSFKCGDMTTKEDCEIKANCKWENKKCIEAGKCGLIQDEKNLFKSISCCQKGVTSYYDPLAEYKYAAIPLGRSCKDICGTGWVTVDDDRCFKKLSY